MMNANVLKEGQAILEREHLDGATVGNIFWEKFSQEGAALVPAKVNAKFEAKRDSIIAKVAEELRITFEDCRKLYAHVVESVGAGGLAI